MPRRRDWGRLVSKTLLLLVGIIFFLPFVWMFLSSLKPSTEVLSSGANLFGSRLEWGNYVDAFTSVPFGRILLNTFGIAAAGALITVTVSVLSAYAFARFRFPFRDQIFAVFIATLVLPLEVLVIPLFIGASSLNLVDTYVAIILPFAFGAFGTFMLRQFLLSLPSDYEEAARIDGASQLQLLWHVIVPLLRGPIAVVAAFSFMLRQFLLSLPSDYEEAARIDGASQLQLLWHVIVPLLRGPIAVVAAFSFIDYWNAFLWPLIIINDYSKAPLQLGLAMFSGERGTEWGALMAASTISVAASLIIVVLMQRQLSKGINLGGFGGR